MWRVISEIGLVLLAFQLGRLNPLFIPECRSAQVTVPLSVKEEIKRAALIWPEYWGLVFLREEAYERLVEARYLSS